MAYGKRREEVPIEGEAIDLGSLVSLPVELVLAMTALDANSKRVVLASERVQRRLIADSGRPILHTFSLVIEREPMTDEEAEQIDTIDGARKASKAAKANAEAETLAREKRSMFELGQSSSINALTKLDELTRAAQVLARQIRP